MALLQIVEPGQSAAPHQHKLAVGIDLGTTHSLVATVRSGTAEVLPDASGRALLPSVVHYAPNGDVDVGWNARNDAAKDPRNTIVSVKRFMGRGVADIADIATFADINATVIVPRGTRIVEVAEKAGANIPFGCKENDCGDCIVEVLQGADNLSSPSALEADLLRQKMAKPGQRLACQAMVLGDVTVKPA